MNADTKLVEECAPAPRSEVIGYERACGVGFTCTGHASCILHPCNGQEASQAPIVLSRQKEPQLHLARVGVLSPSSSLNARLSIVVACLSLSFPCLP